MEETTKKISAIALVKDEFSAKMDELKALPIKDRNELASAIARQRGLTQNDVSFDLVAY